MTRVEFTIRSYMLRDGRFIDVIAKTLGFPRHLANCALDVRVVVDGEDFLKFLVERDRAGLVNGWQNLSVDLIDCDKKKVQCLNLTNRSTR